MEIDEALIRKVATLSRLELKDEEIAVYGRHLASILGYIDQLKEVPVEGVEPLVHAGDFKDVFRDDTVRPSLSNTEALRNAPQKANGSFVVPRVIGEQP